MIILLIILLSVLQLVASQKCDVSNINKADCGYYTLTVRGVAMGWLLSKWFTSF